MPSIKTRFIHDSYLSADTVTLSNFPYTLSSEIIVTDSAPKACTKKLLDARGREKGVWFGLGLQRGEIPDGISPNIARGDCRCKHRGPASSLGLTGFKDSKLSEVSFLKPEVSLLVHSVGALRPLSSSETAMALHSCILLGYPSCTSTVSSVLSFVS